jgi:hypothetical protein
MGIVKSLPKELTIISKISKFLRTGGLAGRAIKKKITLKPLWNLGYQRFIYPKED